MVKKLALALSIALSIFLSVGASQATAENIAGQSAHILYPNKPVVSSVPLMKKRLTIKRMLLKYDSPLAGDVDTFINSCMEYVLDCYLLPSITGLESYFGRYTHPNSYNPFGWGGGYILFDTWGEAIQTVASGLRQNYANRGAVSVEEIGPIYAESKTWAVRVNHFMDLFDKEEQKLDLFLNDH